MDVPTPVVVLLYVPKLKTTVCVKLEDALVMDTATSFVPFTLTEDVTLAIEDARAMVSNVPVPLAVTFP